GVGSFDSTGLSWHYGGRRERNHAGQAMGGGIESALEARAGSHPHTAHACRNTDRANSSATACGSVAVRTSSQSSTYSPSVPSQRAVAGDTVLPGKSSTTGCA